MIENAVRFDLAWRFAHRARPNMLGDATSTGLNRQRLEAADVDALDHVAIADGHGQMSDIASGLHIELSTAERAISGLVGKGLVSLHRDAGDTRAVRVLLTDAGIAVQAEARARRTALATRLLDRLDPEDQQAIGRLLPMLADAIGQELGMPRTVADPDERAAERALAVGVAWRFMRYTRPRVVGRAVSQTANPTLETNDVDTLDQLALDGGESEIASLATALQAQPSTVNRAVNRLTERGLAQRDRHQNDPRLLPVSLTDAGIETQATARDERIAFANRVLENLQPHDQDAIARLLLVIVAAIGNELGIPQQHYPNLAAWAL